jgi:pimeloyl-ACP methyl ester carboxylesterase
MLVDLVRTMTPDGVRLEGAVHVPATADKSSPADLAICLHGVGSNFYSSQLIESVAETLAARGIAALRINTRGHDSVCTVTSNNGRRWQGAAFEIVDECRQDLIGWLDWAREQGFRRVLLVGHSLGGIKALYSMAYEQFPSVVGVAAISPPRLSYAAFREGADNDKFFDSIATAERYLQERRPEALFQAKFPFPLFITASGYLDKYGPRERYNYCRFLQRIDRPLLFTFGGQELDSGSAAFVGVPEAIESLPKINAPLRLEVVHGADHNYSGQHAALGAILAGWVESLKSSEPLDS